MSLHTISLKCYLEYTNNFLSVSTSYNFINVIQCDWTIFFYFLQQSLSATADHDPEQVDSVTPAKRGSPDDMLGQDLASAQLSSTKMAKRIKTEWQKLVL